MPRALFEKKRASVWISHLDLMRLFQRAFKRAGLPLTHTQGYNPRPSVSIALPLSVGVESSCELLDFELDGMALDCEAVCRLLNENLVEGVTVRKVYEDGRKIRYLELLQCRVTLEYDAGVPADAASRISELFTRQEIIVPKKGKNAVVDQNIAPMIRRLSVSAADGNVVLEALVCCQNPTLNPAQLALAVEKYLPDLKPDYVRCSRMEIYETNETVFR